MRWSRIELEGFKESRPSSPGHGMIRPEALESSLRLCMLSGALEPNPIALFLTILAFGDLVLDAAYTLHYEKRERDG